MKLRREEARRPGSQLRGIVRSLLLLPFTCVSQRQCDLLEQGSAIEVVEDGEADLGIGVVVAVAAAGVVVVVVVVNVAHMQRHELSIERCAVPRYALVRRVSKRIEKEPLPDAVIHPWARFISPLELNVGRKETRRRRSGAAQKVRRRCIV